MRQWVRSDRGNILILMAGAMAVLAAFGILTIDIGRILVTRTQLQNGADAAALAGAGVYCKNANAPEAQVKDEAILVGEGNKALAENAETIDLDYDDVEITDAPGGSKDVTVTTSSNTNQYLLGLFTIFQRSDPDVPDPQSDAAVTAVATARCGATCSVSCVKPWAPPDRWDDQTAIAGYTGGGRRPNWRNNNKWDHEAFTDTNDNGLRDNNENYQDNNGNGQYDEEFYHPNLTGYGPDPVPGNYLSPGGDLGLEMVLHFDNGGAGPVPGQYQSIRLPPINKGTPITGADEYRENIANCNPVAIERGDWLEVETGGKVGPTNQGMLDLISK